tara:strand:+ start:242 stop:631 length:390 start_codon:yes stop_codon:yes gene_type:complete
MSIKNYKNHSSFTGNDSSPRYNFGAGFGLSAYAINLDLEEQKSYLLYDSVSAAEDLNTASVAASALFEDVTYLFDVDTSYDGQLFAIINNDRLSTQFIFNSAAVGQTLSAASYDSVGPEIRRLHAQGYV